MAGESADEVARRAREKAERLLKRAEAFEKGATGERLVAEALNQLPPDWFVLNDRQWPGRTRANIDHVVVSPRGVFVIDAKNWSGAMAIKNGVLRQNGYSRMKAIEGASESARAVAALFEWIPVDYFVPVICFVGEGSVNGTLDGVEICSLENLPRVLQSRPNALPPETLQFLRFDLDMSTSNATGTPEVSAAASLLRASHVTTPSNVAQRAAPSPPPEGSAWGNRTPRLARFGLAFFWFFVGSLILGLTLPVANVSENVQGAVGFGLLIGCVVYFFRKR